MHGLQALLGPFFSTTCRPSLSAYHGAVDAPQLFVYGALSLQVLKDFVQHSIGRIDARWIATFQTLRAHLSSGAPVRRIQRIPSRIVRRSSGGRPPDLPTGTIGWMRTHCLSLMRRRAIFCPPKKRIQHTDARMGTQKNVLPANGTPFQGFEFYFCIENPARCAGLIWGCPFGAAKKTNTPF